MHGKTPFFKLFLPLLLSVLMYCGGTSETVHAAGITLLPRVIDLAVQPSDIIAQKVIVKNDSGITLTLFTFVNNVNVGVEGGVQAFVQNSMSDRSSSLSSWIEIQRAGREILPGTTREIPLTFRINSGAVPGTYHALISFASGGNIDEAQSQVTNGTAPNILVTVTLKKPSNDAMKLSGFSIKKLITTFAADNISYRLENTGDTELKPTGDILFYNEKGDEIGVVPVNPQARSIQPKESVLFTAGVPDKELFGKYKGFLTIHYGNQEAAINDTVYFYYAPWKKLLTIFGILLVCVLGLVLWLHHRYGSHDRDNDEDENGAFVPLHVRDAVSSSHARDVVMKKQ